MDVKLSWKLGQDSAQLQYDSNGHANEKQVSILKVGGLLTHGLFLIMYLIFAVLLGVIYYDSSWEDCYYLSSVTYDPQPLSQETSQYLQELQLR